MAGLSWNSCLAEDIFKHLPFPVHPSQRALLQQHKANAVAKEAEVVARRKEKLKQLQKYVLDRTEGKPKTVGSGNTPTRGGVARLPPSLAHTNPAEVSDTRPMGVVLKGVATRKNISTHIRRRRQSLASVLVGVVRGFLTRRLLQSHKVQLIVRTIKDAVIVLESLQNPLNPQDEQLKQSVETQLTVARYELNKIFFQLSPIQRMSYLTHYTTLTHHTTSSTTRPVTDHHSNTTINLSQKKTARSKVMVVSKLPSRNTAHSRMETTGHIHNNGQSVKVRGGGKLSSATIKCMQRRKSSNYSNT